MNYAAFSSLVLILAIVYVPFLHGVFNTVTLGVAQWTFILPLLFLPAVADELTKFVLGPKAVK